MRCVEWISITHIETKYHHTPLQSALEAFQLGVHKLLRPVDRIWAALDATLDAVDAGRLVITALGCTSMHVALLREPCILFISIRHIYI